MRECSYFVYETYSLAWGFKVSPRSSAVYENELKSKCGLKNFEAESTRDHSWSIDFRFVKSMAGVTKTVPCDRCREKYAFLAAGATDRCGRHVKQFRSFLL